MSETTASLRRKISGAGDLQSVVRTMKAVAASSIGQYEKSVRALADYYRTVALGLGACLRESGPAPLIAERKRQTVASAIGAVVLSSDQGLVGQFNDVVPIMRSRRWLDAGRRRTAGRYAFCAIRRSRRHPLRRRRKGTVNGKRCDRFRARCFRSSQGNRRRQRRSGAFENGEYRKRRGRHRCQRQRRIYRCGKDAPMGPGKVCSNISIRGIVYVSIYRLYCSEHEC